MKSCSCCKIEKPFDLFGKDKKTKDGFNCYCKPCAQQKSRDYTKKNPDKVRKSKLAWSEKNPDYQKEHYQENKEIVLERVRDYREKNIQEIREKDKIRGQKNKPKRNERMRKRYYSDPIHKLRGTVRTRIGHYLSKDGYHSVDLIGCSYEFLKEHLEKQFTYGMTWENHGKFGWHVDHKIPLASAKTEDELYKLCHYTNLQPLWWDENLRKGDKIL